MSFDERTAEFGADGAGQPPLPGDPPHPSDAPGALPDRPEPPVRAPLGPEGGEVVASRGRLTLSVPAEAFAERVQVEVEPLSPAIATGNVMLGRWRVVARPDGAPSELAQPRKPLRFRYAFAAAELDGLSVPGQRFVRLDEEAGTWVPLPTEVDLEHGIVTAQADHLSEIGYETTSPMG